MGKSSRKKVTRKPSNRRSGTLGFAVVLGAIVILGVVGVVASRDGETSVNAVGPDIGDHWHAAFGINICGQWKPNTPAYEAPSGVHSHGDGFIHLHPFSRAGAGDNATVGLYMKGAGESVSERSIELTDGTDLTNGDECANLDNKPGKLRWSVNGEERTGDPAEYVPSDLDVIALAFLPEDEEIGVPPVARGGQSPSDLPGQPAPATPPTPAPDATAPATPPTSAE